MMPELSVSVPLSVSGACLAIYCDKQEIVFKRQQKIEV